MLATVRPMFGPVLVRHLASGVRDCKTVACPPYFLSLLWASATPLSRVILTIVVRSKLRPVRLHGDCYIPDRRN
jgi:hypothetical protein